MSDSYIAVKEDASINDAQPQQKPNGQQSRRGLIMSVLTLLLSIPALVGAVRQSSRLPPLISFQ